MTKKFKEFAMRDNNATLCTNCTAELEAA